MQGTATPNIQQSAAVPQQAPVERMASSRPSFRSQRDVIRRNDATPSQSGPALGLDGRCPVTLISAGKWRKGDKRWGAIHRGKTYLFAGPEEQRKFLAKPDDFSPVLAGMDVVHLADNGQVTEGTRRFGVLYDNDGVGPNSSRIYLFDSENSRNRFEASPDEFLRPVMQAMQRGNLNVLRR
jgi:YHS domain-containing protein